MFKLLLVAVVFMNFGCTKDKINQKDLQIQKKAQTIFSPLPKSMIDASKEKIKIELGQKLYFEKKLSINNTISCNSCHMVDKFGVDNEVTSPGHDGTRGGRNSPTVYNAALNFRHFWDGRAKDLAAQAIGPILNPIEHGLKSKKDALEKINTPEYLALFKKSFPGEKKSFTYNNVGHAIAAFEKTLLTPSRFDDYLEGDVHALSNKERKGLKRFMEVGCTSCHSGAGLGGDKYQKIGSIKVYPTKDKGRFEITKKRRDKFKFKVPILRNVTKTAPYLHDGSISSLSETIKIMGEYQLGVELTKVDIEEIEAFLESLEAKKLPKFTQN
jgi:cytochrome c peroxidase